MRFAGNPNLGKVWTFPGKSMKIELKQLNGVMEMRYTRIDADIRKRLKSFRNEIVVT